MGRAVSRETAKTKGHSYGIAYIFLISGGSVLLQERSPNKKSQPGRLDLSAGGHVDERDAKGTDDVDLMFRRAAIREAEEELGIHPSSNDLGLLMRFHEDVSTAGGTPYRKHFRVYIYQVDRTKCRLEYNRDEIANLEWVTIQELTKLPEARITKELGRCREKLQASCR